MAQRIGAIPVGPVAVAQVHARLVLHRPGYLAATAQRGLEVGVGLRVEGPRGEMKYVDVRQRRGFAVAMQMVPYRVAHEAGADPGALRADLAQHAEQMQARGIGGEQREDVFRRFHPNRRTGQAKRRSRLAGNRVMASPTNTSAQASRLSRSRRSPSSSQPASMPDTGTARANGVTRLAG